MFFFIKKKRNCKVTVINTEKPITPQRNACCLTVIVPCMPLTRLDFRIVKAS